MQYTLDLYLIYLIPIALVWIIYLLHRKRKSRRNLALKTEEFEAGLTEPASLHPIIDPAKCMGCGTCVRACPEQLNHPVLGLIDNKAELIAPTNCIGHGACKTACPFDAITLVFGTEKRGVDIPLLEPNFETTMPGIFIAGELGGMGLIRNAIEQGYKALDYISEVVKDKQAAPLDVLIVGAGPAGFCASLRALEKKIRYKTIEQESLGGTVFQFPRGKLVMTAPVKLPLAGEMKFTETTKEKLLQFWQQIEKKTGVQINYHERVEKITPSDKGGYEVKTSKDLYHTRTVLLTIGRRGTPRKLGVPGEDLSKITYRLIDPEQYRNQHVLVVGGGDSALEAATSIAAEPGTTVTLSYRSGAFSRAKKKNREKVDNAAKTGEINLLLSSNVLGFTKETVTIDNKGKQIEIPNDAAIICAGGILPTGFLKETGISVETKHGSA
ncbi:MAG: NAD(P)-binding domain-containing protein [Candidatus Thiodiazotropha sp. (ex Dulcina madagascariensis)]|nr:NAD(P)-binding domain-containing protein [Candidatus Thiodiazotropha sp. (ex Dulcina madagascariensis)]MCU7927923.1 NAD(P)-binding domain-containing protein [Candidatus Thiodiazotropha sp. (ex Dulcina madagascariensis)]